MLKILSNFINRTFLITLGCVLLFFSSCSSKEEIQEPTEVTEGAKTKDSKSVDTPEDELLSKAQKLYESGMYSLARESFSALKLAYPLGPHAELAEIKIADSYFDSSDYAQAASSYEDFAKSRPTSLSTPYALFRAARSRQLSSSGVGRDSSPLERALEYYDKFLTQYPDTIYTDEAKKGRIETLKDLCAYEEKIIKFLERTGKEKAAERHRQELMATWKPRLDVAQKDYVPPPQEPE